MSGTNYLDLSRGLELTRVHGGQPEDCCMCGTTTALWYEEKDVPVCLDCGDTYPAYEIPSKAEWLRSVGIDLPKNWSNEPPRVRIGRPPTLYATPESPP